MNETVQPVDRGSIVASAVSAGVTVIVGVGGAVALWVVRDQLPAQVATHWGVSGRADRFMSVDRLQITNLLICLALPLFLVVVGAVTRRGREIGPFAAAIAVLVSVLVNGSAIGQRGMSAEQVAESSAVGAMLAGSLAAVAVGGGLYVIFRRPRRAVPVAAQVPDAAPRLLVADDVRLAWIGRTRLATGVRVGIGIGGLVILVPLINSALAGYWETTAMMAVVLVLVAALGASMSAHVSVDSRGVRVVALGFVKWVDVPLADISGAEVTRVNPLGDFGGWGKRIGSNGQSGFVTSAGPAVRVRRGDQPDLVITVSDSEAATATINTLVARR